MKFTTPLSINEVVSIIQPTKVLKGNLSLEKATGINEIHSVEKGDLMFVDHPKYYKNSLESLASFIIVPSEMVCPKDKILFVCDTPFSAYKSLVQQAVPSISFEKNTASVFKDSIIADSAFIGQHVKIGSNCIIHPNVVIQNEVEIGDRVVIHPGVVIGGDAFYYNQQKQGDRMYDALPSCGKVVIGDDVDIGSNTSIDRGVSGETRIGSGTKIDNLVHIAHEVVIGKDCIIAAQVGMAGHVVLGNRVTVWGKSGLVSSVFVADDCVILGSTMVTASIDMPGTKHLGIPAIPAGEKKKEFVWLGRLPTMWKMLQELSTK